MVAKSAQWLALASCFLCLAQTSFLASDDDTFTYSTILDHDNKIRLAWKRQDAGKSIVFKLTLVDVVRDELATLVGFGMSDRGTFNRADLCLFSIDGAQLASVSDAHTDERGFLSLDERQDFELIDYHAFEATGDVQIVFKRALDTCDDETSADYVIETGTVHLVYFVKQTRRSSSDVTSSAATLWLFRPALDADVAETKQAQLLKSTFFDSDPAIGHFDPASYEHFEVRTQNVRIPSDDTVYWCVAHKLDDALVKRKHHIVAYEGVIPPDSQGVVHHMELFHCESDPQRDADRSYNGPCKTEDKPAGLRQCRKVIAAWAMGATRFVYPHNVGAPFGGSGYSSYLVLEVHYDNAMRRADIVDSSGLRVYYVAEPHLRTHDAGIMEVGLEYNARNSIPPHSAAFHMHANCLGECTRHGLTHPITVFASQLHTHLSGRRVWTSVVRDKRVVAILNADNHFDQMFQEIRLLQRSVSVHPGDALVNTCVYETSERTNMTLGGFGLRDEMCVNYIHYYPLVPLEVCKSSVDERALRRFLSKQHVQDQDQVTSDEGETSEYESLAASFNSIEWTPARRRALAKFYDSAPISLACNASNGLHVRGVYHPRRRHDNRQQFDFYPIASTIRGLTSDYAPIDPDIVADCRRK